VTRSAVRATIFFLSLPVAALAASAPKPAPAAAPPASQGASGGDPARRFTVTPLAEGVYAVIRDDRPGFMVDANNLFIVNDADVVVVDSNGAPSITRQVVAALKRLTDKPVRYVVNTHYHDDHIRGNQVWREAYPGVEFIAHEFARDYLPGQGATNRKNFLTGAPAFLQDLRGLLKDGKNLAGAPLSAEERASLESDVSLASLVLGEGDQAETVLPTITVRDRLTLVRGERVIDILHLGPGHTGADLVVHLPAERIVATGDLVAWPVPLVGNPQSHPATWSTALERLRELHPAILVPGHGPVLRDDAYVKQIGAMFAAIAAQADAAARRGQSGEAARTAVDVAPYRADLAGSSPVRRALFDMYVAQPAVGAALRDASATGAAALAADVRAAETAFARTMATRDHAAFTAMLADEAVFFGSQRILRGRSAVSEGWRPFFDGHQAPFAWAPERIEVLDSGTLALSSGPVFDPGGARTGTFNSVWRRGDDGRWRIVFDSGCPPCAPPAPAR
jgi:cyclase